MCGLFGTLAVGLFAAEGGLFHGGGVALLGVQVLGAFASAAFAFAVGMAVWWGLSRLPGGVRVSAEHEHEGLDLAECGVTAYGEEIRGMHAETGELSMSRLEPALGAPRAPRAGA
jgi:Amt family ammonium transporter